VDEVAVQRAVAGDRAVPLTRDERISAVHALRAEGLTQPQIAARLSLHQRQVVRDLDTAPPEFQGGGLSMPASPPDSELLRVRLDEIDAHPANIREEIGEGLDELAASIREVGLLQPLIVTRKTGGRYELIAGHRRHAAMLLIPRLRSCMVVVRPPMGRAETVELMLVENLQRRALNPIEEANAYQALVNMGMTHEQIGDRVGAERLDCLHASRAARPSRGNAARDRREADGRGRWLPARRRDAAEGPAAAARCAEEQEHEGRPPVPGQSGADVQRPPQPRTDRRRHVHHSQALRGRPHRPGLRALLGTDHPRGRAGEGHGPGGRLMTRVIRVVAVVALTIGAFLLGRTTASPAGQASTSAPFADQGMTHPPRPPLAELLSSPAPDRRHPRVSRGTPRPAITATTRSGDPTAAQWARLRWCESGRDGSWRVGAASVARGRYQFLRSTWASVGGHGDPAAASYAEQTARALTLWRRSGWAPWSASADCTGLR
jgi:ParB/RepB/Spo0J family partition protein